VARGHRRVRSVLDRLRRITPRILRRPAARRMFIVGGFALVGWLLLGTAGQAHAAARHAGHDHRPGAGGGIARSDAARSGTAASDGLPGVAARSGGVAIGSRLYRGLTGGGQATARLASGGRAHRVGRADRRADRGDRPSLLADGAVTALTGRATGHPPVAAAGVRPRGIVRGVVGSAGGRGVFGRPVGIRSAVAGVLPALRAVTGPVAAPASPAHRAAAPASPRAAGGRAAGRHGLAGCHGAFRAAAVRGEFAPYAGSATVKASDSGRYGRAHARTAPAEPAPLPGLSHRADAESGALPSAGSTPTGGVAGHSARPEAAPRPSAALTSVLGAVPPAVRTATHEPAVTPD
jgi:hypothetical protein